MSEAVCVALADECSQFVGSMGGPAIAIEMARGRPVAVIIGIEHAEGSRAVQAILQNDYVKVQTTSDIVGLELCSTLKNVYAIALGICDGVGFGTNTKAFFASLAMDEMSDITEALGGRRETVYGLAGLGDLLTTGFSAHSRNRTFGEKLGAGSDWREFMEASTVEGVVACQAVSELVAGRGLSTQLLDTIHDVLFANRPGGGSDPALLRGVSRTADAGRQRRRSHIIGHLAQEAAHEPHRPPHHRPHATGRLHGAGRLSGTLVPRRQAPGRPRGRPRDLEGRRRTAPTTRTRT